jgi:hypothetical protein
LLKFAEAITDPASSPAQIAKAARGNESDIDRLPLLLEALELVLSLFAMEASNPSISVISVIDIAIRWLEVLA